MPAARPALLFAQEVAAVNAPIDFYLEQAANCGKAAEETLLPNERSKFLRSQLAWQAMADRRSKLVAARNKDTTQ